MMGWGWDWGWGWHGGGLPGLFHVLWWVLVVVAIVALIRAVVGGRGGLRGSSDDRALAILRERYARGEIDKAEFEQRKRDLGADRWRLERATCVRACGRPWPG